MCFFGFPFWGGVFHYVFFEERSFDAVRIWRLLFKRRFHFFIQEGFQFDEIVTRKELERPSTTRSSSGTMKRVSSGVGVAVCILCLFSLVLGRPRYQEEGSSVWYVNNTVLNNEFVMGVAKLEFDEELYVNGPTTACAFRDRSCPSIECVPCDWSGQNPVGCSNLDCCGPSTWNATADELDAWCDESYTYETLSFGDSETFEGEEGEWQYYRFFLPESLYCRTIVVTLRPFYGFASMVMSSQIPNPDFDSFNWAVGNPAPGVGLGVTTITLCPTAHDTYTLGTYTIGVFSNTPTSYRIDIEYATETQPFAPPPDRLPCSSVPPEEFARRGSAGEPVVCLEDGVTQRIESDQAYSLGVQQVQMIVPLQPGCQKISFFGQALSKSLDFAVHCLSPIGSENTRFQNTLYSRFGSRRDQAVSFNLCFEEITYLTCALRFYTEGDVEAVFSTEAETKMRKMVELPHASLSYQDGMGAAIVAPFGGISWACVDFYVYCYNWLSPPSTDPLVLYPVNSNLRFYYYSSDLVQEYMDAGLSVPLNNTLVVTFSMNVGNSKVMSYDTSILSLSVLTVTNEFGEPVLLPNNGPDSNPPTVPSYALASKYVPNIAIDSLPLFNPAPFCDSDKYDAFQDLVQDKIDLLLDNSLSFDEVLYNKYAIDVFNGGIAGSSCNFAISDRIATEINDVNLFDQIACLLDPVYDRIQWLFEPCCDPYLEITRFCLPYDINTTLQQFTDDSDVEGCGIPQCAESYMEEVGYAFNNVGDRILGCSSGIVEAPFGLEAAQSQDLNAYVISCLAEAGFGDHFEGTECIVDSDCDEWTGQCNFETGLCATLPLEDMENAFLSCFIANMSSSLENLIRNEAMQGNQAIPRDSPEFMELVRKAATREDCVNVLNPLDISKRERYAWDAQRLLCKADSLGISIDDVSNLNEFCPPGLCLGDFCLQNNTNCRARCDLAYQYIEMEADSCSEQTCVSGDCDDEDHCMYCPPGEDACIIVPAITDRETCDSSIACELPSGEIVFDLTEAECRNVAQCSSDCAGPSCVSFDGIDGVCAFGVTDLVTCNAFGATNGETVIFEDGYCLVESISAEAACVGYQATNPTVQWYTCTDFATGGECGSLTNYSAIQRFMNCYESIWTECTTEEQCLASGYCSDRPYTTTIHSYDYPIVLQIGGCISSGEYFGNFIPNCAPGETHTRGGCLNNDATSPDLCIPFYGLFIYQSWITPAMSQEECQAVVFGRWGCVVPGDLDQVLWIMNPEECEGWSGTPVYSWEWTPGVWRRGVARSLEWRAAEDETLYGIEERLSFLVISEWVKENTLEKFLQVLRSEVLCTSNSITYPMFTLVCDCESDKQGENCYDIANDKEILMGFSYACANENSTIQHPSAKVAFHENSLTQGCTDVNISIIYKNWYRAPFIPPPVSFNWEDRDEKGPVVNTKKSTVGSLVGDGCGLSFSNFKPMKSFEVCLLYSGPQGKWSSKYSEKDFGYIPDLDSEFIYPLGLEEVRVEERADYVFYCADVEYFDVPSESDDVIYLFPIVRVEDYDDVDDDYVSKQTEVLMYFLGVCYCILIPSLFVNLYKYFKNGRRKVAPLSFWMGIIFIIFCVFRAVFMFLYPQGDFEGNTLAEFVVFEIPTFLLISIVIICIYFWKKVVIKKNHFIPEKNNEYIIYIGFPVIWAIWLIVTLVYSEVILEDDSSSPCGGRVAVDYSDQEDNTRILAIVYHSIIITITLILSIIFLYYTVTIINDSKKQMSNAKEYIVVIGGLICGACVLRSVLFLILLAVELASSIYLFITLLLTEVILIAFTQLQFHRRALGSIFDGTVSSTKYNRSSSSSTVSN